MGKHADGPPREGPLARHGRRMARWRWVVIPLWVLVIAVAAMFGGRIGDVLTDEAHLPGSDAERGVHLIESHFAGGGEFSEVTPVFRSPGLTVDDPEYRDAVTAGLDRAAAIVPGTEVVSYFSNGARDMVGDDGHLSIATLRMPVDSDTASDHVPAIREALGTPAGFEPTLLGGDAAEWYDMEPIITEDLMRAELIVLPVALLILLLFFGSLTSALLPFVVAISSVLLAMAGTWATGQSMDIASQALNVIVLVGIGIGIDYALLIVSRFRKEIAAGASREDALALTTATAGRAVILSGATVAIGLAALVAIPLPFIQSIGIGGLLVPVFAVITALTVLPAILATLGRRVDSLRVYPRRWRLPAGAIFGPIGRLATRGAVPVAAVCLIALGALALQSGNLNMNQDSLADGVKTEANEAGLIIRDQLGGGAASPNIYVIDSGRPDGVYAPGAMAELRGVADAFRDRSDIVAGVTWPSAATPEGLRAASAGVIDPTGRYALMNVAAYGDPLSDQARAVNDLMLQEADGIEAAMPGGEVVLTGEPAAANEFNSAMYDPFPYLVIGVLVLTFLVLTIAFRGWVIPLISVLVTALSLLAVYGLMVLVFQEGVGSGLLGMDHEVRGIAPWVPLFVFAFLFGISMDYQVFLLERMRELRKEGHTSVDSIAFGVRDTGRIIVTAAAIMATAFGGFAAGQMVDMKEFGFALASAVVIDALVVRPLLVPALMRLAGTRCWPKRMRVGGPTPAAVVHER